MGLIATSLTATPAFAINERAQAHPANTVSEAPLGEPTVSDVELTPVEAPAEYTDSLTVPESAGDAQQKKLKAAPLRAASQVGAGVARIDLNSDIAVFGVVWDVSDSEPVRVEYRTLGGDEWSAWAELEVEATPESVDPEQVTQHGTEPAFVTSSEAVEVVAYTEDGEPATDLRVNLIDPNGADPVRNSLAPAASDESAVPEASEESERRDADVTPEEGQVEESLPPASEPESDSDIDSGQGAEAPAADKSQTTATAEASISTAINYATGTADAAPVAGLSNFAIKSRKSWGPNEGYRDKDPDPGTKYKGAIVHHTAGGNSYTRGEVPGIIRGVYYYHAVTKRWGDIGYHLIVDKYGGVWEGRYGALSRSFVGAQAIGANYDTFGISVLGTFTSSAPPAAAQDAVAKGIAWMFNKFNIKNPNGKMRIRGVDNVARTLPTIAGHREVGSGTWAATACPGTPFQNRLPSIRNKVESYMWPPLSGMVQRHEDKDRFGTAAKAALATHKDGADTVYIANGMDFPDALAGGAAAGLDDAPMLLTLKSSVPSQTTNAIKKLKPGNIIILGGKGTVSASVEKKLGALASNIERLGGTDRYDTAAKIADAKFDTASTVYVASGQGFPDALSAVPVAGDEKSPLLLTQKGILPATTEKALNDLDPDKIVILGGTGVVNTAVERSLKKIANSERLSGKDRFETSANVALSGYSDADTVYVATGLAFPDALAGGPAATVEDAPLLLVWPHAVPAETEAALKKLGPKKIMILGGDGAVNHYTERVLDRYITK